ncbi:hypothetical protein K6Y31_03370 [Motilimonas cestriensis]|uniref:Uncharacterized protein n=1 Tax=Motilimonas cestriensis TaxID=2742685 RepID=A0ABS8W6E6_9GAMM|nr:hypothetical protein [Motilimonas cestriensis]MCE2593850.1 hypothetical protein [Motilimonas cestriensis]
MEFDIKYGSAFSIDKWGFVGKGKVKISDDKITFSGRQAWPAWKKLLTGLIFFSIPTYFLKFGLAFVLPTFVVVHYLCVSKNQLSVLRSSISNIEQKGKKISSKAQQLDSKHNKKSLFQAYNIQVAQDLISALKSKKL